MPVEADGLLATLEEAWLGIALEAERMAAQPSGPRSGSLTR
jgi:flagellar secretion chaperone FliS